MRAILYVGVVLVTASGVVAQQRPARPPIIDVHLHTYSAAMAEVTAQYEGLSPSDPSLDPYFALAEELDVPAGTRTGTSFPGGALPATRTPRKQLRECHAFSA